MDLFILRHGEAGKRLSSETSDSARPLTVTGKRDVTDIAKSLKDFGVKLNLIITSPLKRAHQTASLVAVTFSTKNKIEDWAELKPEGNRRELYHKLSQQFKQDLSILIVGHEPYLSTLISEVTSVTDDASSRIILKKAGLAKMRITSHSAQIIHGELEWLLTPKLMKNISK